MKKPNKISAANKQEDEDVYILYPENAFIRVNETQHQKKHAGSATSLKNVRHNKSQNVTQEEDYI